jgi:hypothetical protein
MDERVVLVLSDSEEDEIVDLLNPVCELFFFESSSSSSSEEEEDPLEVIEAVRERRGPLRLRPRIKNYVERVVPTYSADEFKSHFRYVT